MTKNEIETKFCQQWTSWLIETIKKPNPYSIHPGFIGEDTIKFKAIEILHELDPEATLIFEPAEDHGGKIYFTIIPVLDKTGEEVRNLKKIPSYHDALDIKYGYTTKTAVTTKTALEKFFSPKQLGADDWDRNDSSDGRNHP